MAKQSTYVLWKGPSEIDGKEIMVIATNVGAPCANSKTGDMIQIWYMPTKIEPHLAVKTGDDRSVCGSCPLRPSLKEKRPGSKPCYVRVWQAPLSVYRGAHRKGLVDAPSLQGGCDAIHESGKDVRLGAWGDPGSVPQHVNRAILDAVRKEKLVA